MDNIERIIHIRTILYCDIDGNKNKWDANDAWKDKYSKKRKKNGDKERERERREGIEEPQAWLGQVRY